MHFVRKPLSFFEHGTQSPMLDPAIKELRCKDENQRDASYRGEMPSAPPGRSRKHADVISGAQKEHERRYILRVFRIDDTYTTQAQKTAGFQLAKKHVSAPRIHDRPKRLFSFPKT